MPEEKQASLGHLELAGSLFALSAAILFFLRDLFILHPAYAVTDESRVLLYTQLGLEGRHLPWMAFTGSLLRYLQYLSALIMGAKISSLHLPVLVALVIESFLLWRLARHLAGPRAALGSLLFNVICAFSMIRARSLLSFSILPCELLALLNLMLEESSEISCFLAGLMAGIFMLDYEAWIFGVAVVGTLALSSFLQGKGRKKAIFAGLVLGIVVTLWISRDALVSYVLVRSHFSSSSPYAAAETWIGHLHSFFLGGDTIAYLGSDQHASVPSWSLIFLAAGLVCARKHAWIWPWLVLGFIPLALSSDALEPNRMIVAWPALALLAGWGWSWLWDIVQQKISGHLVVLLFFAILAAGWCDETAAYANSMAKNYASYYGRSEARIQEGAYLRKLGVQVKWQLLSHLTLFDGAEIRFDTGFQSPSLSLAKVTAWIPDAYLPFFTAKSGSWVLIQPFPNVAPERLLFPSETYLKQLESADQTLEIFENGLSLLDQRQNQKIIFAWLEGHPKADPWVRTALWSQAMHYASLSGDVSEARIQALLSEPLVSAEPLYEPGIFLIRDHPGDALRLLEKAKQIDARRTLSTAIYSQIRDRAKSMQEENPNF